MYRITLTKNIVNQADHIVFMVSGYEKAHAFTKCWKEKKIPTVFPHK